MVPFFSDWQITTCSSQPNPFPLLHYKHRDVSVLHYFTQTLPTGQFLFFSLRPHQLCCLQLITVFVGLSWRFVVTGESVFWFVLNIFLRPKRLKKRINKPTVSATLVLCRASYLSWLRSICHVRALGLHDHDWVHLDLTEYLLVQPCFHAWVTNLWFWFTCFSKNCSHLSFSV